MSYLDTLNRAKSSPTTDYFLGLLLGAEQTDLVREFFGRDPIVEIRNRYISVTQQLEKESRNKSIDITSNEALLEWERVATEYNELRKELENSWQSSSIEEFPDEKVASNDNEAREAEKEHRMHSGEPTSDLDYLRSLIGIFEFEQVENDSEQVEEIVSNALRSKYSK